jgi:hypothetical protein
MTILTYNNTQFRLEFPAFSDPVAFPTTTLQLNWTTATFYIDDNGSYGWMQGATRQYAIDLMAAHITALSIQIAAGQVPEIINNATIDKITVGLQPPPLKNQWQWWLQTTPYGMALNALLQAQSVGGWYVGGVPQISGFRRPGVGWPFCR